MQIQFGVFSSEFGEVLLLDTLNFENQTQYAVIAPNSEQRTVKEIEA